MFPLDPNSPSRLALDLISVFMLFVDLTLIPYTIAFDIPVENGLKTFFRFTVAFWTIDVGLNFVTSYNIDGVLEIRLGEIARHYVKHSFCLDISIVVCDWASTILADSIRGLSMLRLAKATRLARIAGLFRMMKLARIIQDVTDTYMSEGLGSLFRVLSIFSVVLWLTHLIGCTWYALGQMEESDTGRHWPETEIPSFPSQNTYADERRLYQYATSIHWAMSQLTLGAVELVACNTVERLFTILLLLLGLLSSSTLVSSLSATLIGLQMRSNEKYEKMRILRQFLRQNRVDPPLAVRIKQQAINRISKAVLLSDKDVDALQIISSSLHAQLYFQLFKPYLMSHPLFRFWINASTSIVHELCVVASNLEYLQQDDDLFIAGVELDCAYHLCTGSVNYSQDPESSAVSETSTTSVRCGSWLCESALWTYWTTVGKAEAETTSQLLVVHATPMATVLRKHRLISHVTREYSQLFHKRVVLATPPQEWPTDLEVPETDFVDMVRRMQPATQMTIGLQVVKMLSASLPWTTWRGINLDKLAREVTKGKCSLVETGSGDLIRCVSVIAGRIMADDGCILVQLGKLRGRNVELNCSLPGFKLASDESPDAAFARLLKDRLSLYADAVQVVNWGDHVVWEDSARFKVRTRYVRHVFNAKLVDCSPVAMESSRVSGLGRGGSIELMSKEPEPTSWAHSSLMFRFSHNSQPDKMFEDIISRHILAFPDNAGEDMLLYAWVKDNEFEFIQQPDNEPLLHQWITMLDLESLVEYGTRRKQSNSILARGPLASRFSVSSRRHSWQSDYMLPFEGEPADNSPEELVSSLISSTGAHEGDTGLWHEWL